MRVLYRSLTVLFNFPLLSQPSKKTHKKIKDMLDSCYQHLDNQGFSSSMYDTQVCAASCNCNFYWNCIVAFYLRTTQQVLTTSAFQIESDVICKCWFLRRGEKRSTPSPFPTPHPPLKKKQDLAEQGKEPTTTSTHIWRRQRDLNPGHIGGRRALSPLRHPSLYQVALNRLNVIAEILACSLIFNLFIFLQTLDIPGLSLSQQEYYPYVFYQIKLDVMER